MIKFSDRWMAITDPITYPSRMTPNKAALFIAGIWTCSALISFPAIAWWRAVREVFKHNQIKCSYLL